MKCAIGNKTFRFDRHCIKHYSDLTVLQFGIQEYRIFEDAESAGEKAKEYWTDLLRNDESTFVQIVGISNLISWSKGNYVRIGNTKVKSLSAWLDRWLDNPAEHWANYDGLEYDIYFNYCSREIFNGDGSFKRIHDEIEELFGFIPTVAYRYN